MPTYDGQHFSPPAPVAMVSVVNPDTGITVADVRMLIDTGADISVLPESVVGPLALAVGNRDYEVLSYDNRVGKCHAVRATIVLARRRVTGQYVVLDQEVGILGRDVLNYFVVVLDGPNATWDSR